MDFDGITDNSSVREVRAALALINISEAVQDIFEGTFMLCCIAD